MNGGDAVSDDTMRDDPNLPAEQRLALHAGRMRIEVAAVTRGDTALAERIMGQVVAAFDEGLRRGEAARVAEAADPDPDPDPGTLVGTIRTIGPDEIRERRWAE